MSNVWIYEKDNMLMVFDTEDDARAWLARNDPAGVVAEQKVGLLRPVGSADQHGVPRATDTRPRLYREVEVRRSI